MTQKFIFAVGCLFLIVGILSFVFSLVGLTLAGGVFYLLCALLFFWSSRNLRTSLSMAKWSGLVAIVLAAFGFAGLSSFIGVLALNAYWSWFYLGLGLVSVWFWVSEKPIS